MRNLIYDGKMDCGDTTMHFFISEDIEHAAQLFEDLCEEDIHAFVVERVYENNYAVTGCTICVTVHNKSHTVQEITITAIVVVDDKEVEIEPESIALDEDALQILLDNID